MHNTYKKYNFLLKKVFPLNLNCDNVYFFRRTRSHFFTDSIKYYLLSALPIKVQSYSYHVIMVILDQKLFGQF